MYFDDWNSLLLMDGHGLYVWTAYGLGLAVLVWNVVMPLRQRRHVVAEMQRQARRERAQQESRP